MPKRENYLLVGDLIECFTNILDYTKGISFDDFIDDKKTKDAVVRNFEIIGEASKLLTEEFKSDNPQVEWRLMTGFRNKLIHEYFGIDYDAVWKIIQEEAQEHLDFLETIEFEK